MALSNLNLTPIEFNVKYFISFYRIFKLFYCFIRNMMINNKYVKYNLLVLINYSFNKLEKEKLILKKESIFNY